jgi:DNA-binding NarL/FixJ family response regulator
MLIMRKPPSDRFCLLQKPPLSLKKPFNFLNGQDAFDFIVGNGEDEKYLILLDINMPGLDGIEVLEKVNKQKLKTKVVLLTMHKEMTVFKKANQHGVFGYILKEHAQDELEKCLKEVIKGNQYISKSLINELILDNDTEVVSNIDKLTFTEKKILELIAQQKTTKQIAELLFIAEKTVEGHRTNIIQKLELPKEKNALLLWASTQFKK